MKLNLEKLKSYSSLELCKLLSPVFEKIKENYSFVEIEEHVYKKIMLISIEEIMKNMDEKKLENFDLYFVQKTKKHINKYIKKQLFNPIKFNTILNNFISLKIKNNNDYENSVSELKKISSFFSEIEFVPSVDLYIELLKNPTIEDMTKLIVKVNWNIITNNNIDNLFKDEVLISIIEIYCMINHIKIKGENDVYGNQENIESEYISSTVKEYLKTINKPVLSEDEERELAYRILKGDENAKQILIERNLKLVVHIAKMYQHSNLSFMDLIQEGNIGLMTAVDKYDVTKGYRFSSYACYWIKQQIVRSIRKNGRNIRIPDHFHDKINKYRETEFTLTKKLNREPKIEEIAKEMKISVAKATELYRLQNDTISINRLVQDDEERELEYFIPDSSQNIEDKAINSVLQTNVKDFLQKCNLTEQESQILMLRYGLGNCEQQTLEQIGKNLNRTRERIRQIEANAIKKIRKSKYIEEFASYMSSPTEAMKNIQTYRELYNEKQNKNKKFGNLQDSKQLSFKAPVKETNVLPKNEKLVTQQKEFIKKTRGRKLPTIYEHFKEYTREEINIMLSKLSAKDMELVRLRYGDDLDNPVTSPAWTKKCSIKFYNKVIPKMKRLLSNPTTEIKKLKTIYEYFKEYTREEINIMLSKLSTEDMELVRLRYGDDLDNPVTSPAWTRECSNKFYCKVIPKMKKLLSNPTTEIKKLKTIYELFKEYTREEIDVMLSKLSAKDMELVRLRYGDDLDNPVTSPAWTRGCSDKFYAILVPKMKKLLSNPTTEIKKLKTIYEYFKEYTREKIDIMLSKLSAEDMELVRLRYGDDLDNPVTSPAWTKECSNKFYNKVIPKMKKLLSNPTGVKNKYTKKQKPDFEVKIPNDKFSEIEKEDYIKILELVKTLNFGEMLKILSPKEAIIICLTLGYVDGKYFTAESVAGFLGIEKEEVIETTKKVLLSYKENINQFIDKSIEVTTGHSLSLKKI